MDNKNNNFKEFHTVHRFHGFTDVSTSFQMCVKNARFAQFARTATNCNSKNIKRKITHPNLIGWVKSFATTFKRVRLSDSFSFLSFITLNHLNTHRINGVGCLSSACQSLTY